jgi:hypothetical protein
LARKEEIGEAVLAPAADRSGPSQLRVSVIGLTDQYFATMLDNLLPAFGI